jgi:hypothetical protein
LKRGEGAGYSLHLSGNGYALFLRFVQKSVAGPTDMRWRRSAAHWKEDDHPDSPPIYPGHILGGFRVQRASLITNRTTRKAESQIFIGRSLFFPLRLADEGSRRRCRQLGGGVLLLVLLLNYHWLNVIILNFHWLTVIFCSNSDNDRWEIYK